MRSISRSAFTRLKPCDWSCGHSRAPIKMRTAVVHLAIALASGLTLASGAEGRPSENKPSAIAIADMKQTRAVDFEKDILPVFKNNCLACHNLTKSKADLVLETPQTILKGGESGPAIVPGRGAESLLLKAAAHQSDPTMPPRDNKVAASNLTPQELGLLKLWIDQGAKGEVHAAPIAWKPLPQTLNPIYAVALTADGQFAACGRANQIFIYHLSSGQLMARLSDPHLSKDSLYQNHKVAHRDTIHSLAFNPDGTLLASGDYRQAKLWRRTSNVQKLSFSDPETNTWKTVAMSPDGEWLATGSAEGKVKLFDLTSGKEAKLLARTEKAISILKFSPDGTRLASGSVDKKIRIWSPLDGQLLAEAETSDAVNALTWVAAGKQIATGGADKMIHIWKLPDSGKGEMTALKELKGHVGAISCLDTILPAGNEIISGSQDGSIRHWNVEKGQSIREIKHGSPIASVAVRPDGKRFASAGTNNIVKLWNSKDGKQIAELKGDRYRQEALLDSELALAFSSGEVSSRKTGLQTAETLQKALVERVGKATDALRAAGKLSEEKQKLVETAQTAKSETEKALAVLRAEITKVTEDFQTADQAAKKAAVEAKAAVEKAAQATLAADQATDTQRISDRIASDTATVAAGTKAAAERETAEVGKASASKLAADVETIALKAKRIAESMAADANAKSKMAADANTLAEKAIDNVAAKSFAAGQMKPPFDKITADADEKQKQGTNKITAAIKKIADAEKEFKKAELAKLNAENELQLARKSLDQAVAAVTAAMGALQTAEMEKKQADADAQVAKKAASEAEKPIRTIAFSPDNLTLGTGGDDQLVHTWSAEDGAAFETFKGHRGSVSAVAYGKEGALVLSASDHAAIIWDANPAWTLESVIGTGDATSPIVDRVNALRFSPNGRLLATGSGEPTRSGEIKIWALADGKLVQELKNIHSDTVFSLDFSADGKHLASGSADRFVKVVELATGKIVKSFEGHTHHVLGVSWKRDGRTLASSGADHVIKMWDFVTGEKKKTIEGFTKEVTSISFVGRTDQTLVCSGDNQVRTVKENGDKVRSFDGVIDFMHSAAVSADGRIVVAGGQDSVLRVWNAIDGKVLTAFAPSNAQ